MMYRKIQKLHFTCMPVNVHVCLFKFSVCIEFNVGPHEGINSADFPRTYVVKSLSRTVEDSKL